MAITINGTGSITGLTAGGLPDGSVVAADLASSLDLTGKTVTLPSGTGGKILQVVYGSTTSTFASLSVIPNDDTIPQNTEGTEFLTASITPISASSTLFVQVNVPCISSNSTGNVMVALFRDSGVNAIAAASTVVASNDYEEVLSFDHTAASSATSSTTFKLRFGSNSASYYTYINRRVGGRILGGVLASTLTIFEVAS